MAAARSNSGQSATNSPSNGYRTGGYRGRASQAKMHEGTTTVANNTMMASPQAKSQANTKAKSHGDDDTDLVIDETIVENCSLGDVHAYFSPNSSEIEGGKIELETLADCLTTGNLGGHPVVLTGHTDPRGTARYDMKLGKSRAEAVADVLANAGVPRDQMVIKSVGKEGDSSSASEWPYERRVDVQLK